MPHRRRAGRATPAAYFFLPALRPPLREAFRAVFFFAFLAPDFFFAPAAFFFAFFARLAGRFAAPAGFDPEDLRARAPPLARCPSASLPPISGSCPPVPISGMGDVPVSSSSGIPIPVSNSSCMMRLVVRGSRPASGGPEGPHYSPGNNGRGRLV